MTQTRLSLYQSGAPEISLLSRLKSNRLTRGLSDWLHRRKVARNSTRLSLNLEYIKMSHDDMAEYHARFAKIFRHQAVTVESGEWYVMFQGQRINLPIEEASIWLDWDNATSILGHESEIKQTYAHLVKSPLKPELFIDVGANYGTHACLLASHGIKTTAFEPNSQCVSKIHTIQSLNDFSFDVVHAAVGDNDTPLEIAFPEHETWLGSTDESTIRQLSSEKTLVTERVKQVRLDDVLSDFPQSLVLLKIDTEGSELAVLRGADSFLERAQPMILFESWKDERRSALVDFLSSRKYRIYTLPWNPADASTPMNEQEFVDTMSNNFIAIPSHAQSHGEPD